MESNMVMTGKDYLTDRKKVVDRLLDEYLPSENSYPDILHQAMRYSVLAGGKRIRPILAMTSYEAFGGHDSNIINPAACSLELVHTYSLIHDDLPCMDDDDLRRGMPTLHRKYNEAVAVLAGDALHDLAFELIARSGSAQVVSELARAIGTFGMLGGQMADVEAEGKDNSIDQIEFIHKHKTGALIQASVRIGALLAMVDKDTFDSLTLYGEKIGLAFQIIDDILDIEGDEEKLGKVVGSDSKNDKATYPGTVGIEQARREGDRLIDDAISIAEQFKLKKNYFINIARFIGQRDN